VDRKRLFNIILAFLVLAVSFGTYFNILSNGLVYDDKSLILENPWIKDIRYIPEVFFTNIWAFKFGVGGMVNYYRPVVHLIYMADYHLFGLEPWGYHLSKLLLHVGSTLMVFLIASTIIKRHMNGGSDTETPQFYIPFAAALLFATHPVHTECVTIATAEVSFAFFFLLSFYLYLSSDGVWGMGLIASALFFFLAILCKETALVLPVLLFAYDHTFKRDITLNLSKRTIYLLVKRYFPYLVAAGLYFALRTYALWGIPTFKAHAELGAWGYIINVFPLFAQHLGKLMVPVNLNAAYVLHPVTSVLEWKALLSIAVTLGFIAAVYVARNMNRVVFFGLLWIAVPLLPALYIPALGDHTFAERYLYLPSVGFVIIVATALCAVASFARPGRWAVSFMLSAVFIIVTLYSAGTITRIPVWKDDLSLWSDTVSKSPDDAIPHNNLGLAYYKMGRTDEAIEEFKKAIGMNPDYAKAHNNLGLAYTDKSLIDEAIEEYKFALRLKPDLPEAHNNLGIAYLDLGRTDEGIEEYKEALRLNPYYVVSHNNLGLAYYDLGRMDGAIEEYKKAISLNPDYALAHNNLGLAYYDLGRMDGAIEEYKKAISLNPDYALAHNNLGLAYYDLGRMDEAIEEYKKAISLNLGHIAHNNLGFTYMERERLDLAEKHLKKALELNSSYEKSYFNLGLLYAKEKKWEKAIVHFKKAISLEPDHADTHARLGAVLMRTGQLDEAEIALNNTLLLKPDYMEARFYLGIVHGRKGQLDKAIEQFSHVIELNPRHPRAHYNLGLAYERKGLLKEAEGHYKKALEIKPDHIAAREQLKGIQKEDR
jgi:tetratricopeptide (TPR) repeat protein